MRGLGETFGARGLSIVGYPCNQFLFQESGTDAEIKKFAVGKGFVGDAFDLMAKVSVNGSDVDPVFAYLKREAPCSIKWNFGAYFLVSRDGKVESHEGVNPAALKDRIAELLGPAGAEPAVDLSDVGAKLG